MQDRKKDTDVYNGLLDSEGEGEGGTIWENGTETCIISYKKQIASPGSIQDAWDSDGAELNRLDRLLRKPIVKSK